MEARPGRGSGSSPHTRGAPGDPEGPLEQLGIIPAYAGSTRARGKESIVSGDHPRIRGEHVWKTERYNLATGSSPHTRGAPRETFADAEADRIIPAYAGSTCTTSYGPFS